MCLRSFVEQTGETQTRWKTWPNWLPGPESPKKTEKKTRALEFNDGPQKNYDLTASESRKYHQKGHIVFL